MMLVYDKPPTSTGTGALGSGCGGVLMACPICGTGFRRPPSHAARVAVNYCGRGCAAEGSKVRIATACVVCEKPMEQTPSEADRIKTCGKACSSLRRRGSAPKPRSFASYKVAAKRIAARCECAECGAKHGPWIVRGLRVSFNERGEAEADERDAQLWCQRCHLQSIAHAGGQARKESR